MHTIKNLFHISKSRADVFAAISTIEGLSSWWTKTTSGDTSLGGVIEFIFNPEILQWDKANRTLTLKNKPVNDEYLERVAGIQFSEDYSEYVWKGTNKSSDPQKPNKWEYEEKGNKH